MVRRNRPGRHHPNRRPAPLQRIIRGNRPGRRYPNRRPAPRQGLSVLLNTPWGKARLWRGPSAAAGQASRPAQPRQGLAAVVVPLAAGELAPDPGPGLAAIVVHTTLGPEPLDVRERLATVIVWTAPGARARAQTTPSRAGLDRCGRRSGTQRGGFQAESQEQRDESGGTLHGGLQAMVHKFTFTASVVRPPRAGRAAAALPVVDRSSPGRPALVHTHQHLPGPAACPSRRRGRGRC